MQFGVDALREPRIETESNAHASWIRCGVASHRGLNARLPGTQQHELRVRLAEREAAYSEADITVDASRGGPDAVAERVVNALRRGLGGDATPT